jgi:hypothetical protein
MTNEMRAIRQQIWDTPPPTDMRQMCGTTAQAALPTAATTITRVGTANYVADGPAKTSRSSAARPQ